MDLDTAQGITQLTVKAFMAKMGIGNFSNQDAKDLGNHSLEAWLTANRICEEHRGKGYEGMLVEARGLAELYLRLTNSDFHTIEDVEKVADAAEALFGEATYGYGVVIDAQGNSNLVRLNRIGTGGEEVESAGSFSELYKTLNRKAAKLAGAEEDRG